MPIWLGTNWHSPIILQLGQYPAHVLGSQFARQYSTESMYSAGSRHPPHTTQHTYPERRLRVPGLLQQAQRGGGGALRPLAGLASPETHCTRHATRPAAPGKRRRDVSTVDWQVAARGQRPLLVLDIVRIDDHNFRERPVFFFAKFESLFWNLGKS